MNFPYFLNLLILTLALSCSIGQKRQVKALSCGESAPRALQILGSGGPELDDHRNSTGYLIWINGKARVLIDVGAGVAKSFGENGAKVSDLDFIGFSHFHVDHSGGFPALIKGYFFENRRKHILVAGPERGAFTSSAKQFLSALFTSRTGAYKYLENLIGHEGFEAQNLSSKTLGTIFENSKFKVMAVPVDHGKFPAIAYRINFTDGSIVFSGDTRASTDALIHLARDADLFIAHHAVPQSVKGVAESLHMKPQRIGVVAKKSNVKKVILSHRMKRTLGKDVEMLSQKMIQKNYLGPLVWAEDEQCIPF